MQHRVGVTDEERERVRQNNLHKPLIRVFELGGTAQPYKSLGVNIALRSRKGEPTPIVQIELEMREDGTYITPAEIPQFTIEMHEIHGKKARMTIRRAEIGG